MVLLLLPALILLHLSAGGHCVTTVQKFSLGSKAAIEGDDFKLVETMNGTAVSQDSFGIRIFTAVAACSKYV